MKEIGPRSRQLQRWQSKTSTDHDVVPTEAR